MPASTGKKGGKKYGRGLRSPAHQRYNAEDRRNKNKKRKMAKNAKREARDKLKRDARDKLKIERREKEETV